jgi:glutathione synthase/RimK-type ligase-like ATP-grasp enzyme
MTHRSPPEIGIVTGEKAPDLTADGQALQAALRDRGFSATPVLWTAEDVDWSAFDAVLVRSCWDYHSDLDAFRSWLNRVEAEGVVVLNATDVIRWNLHKFYLRDLADRGVQILPTTWVEREADVDLETALRYNGWQDAVVKPAVGTSSTGVWRTSLEDAATHQHRFEDLVANGDALVQAYAPEIDDGERSLVFFEGTFSHATKQAPAADDFRAHPTHGGTATPYDPPRDIVEQAGEVLAAAGTELGVSPAELPYARVDGIERDGEFRLMELELIEPFLNLQAGERAVTRFAGAIESSLERHAVAGTDGEPAP